MKLKIIAQFIGGGATAATGVAMFGAIAAGDVAHIWTVGALITVVVGVFFIPSDVPDPVMGRHIDAIEFAMTQGVDAADFLIDWYSENLDEWPEYAQFLRDR